jgi:hypothetical protein
MIKKVAHKAKQTHENVARKSILQDLFYDFNKNRKQVYLMNFFRGIFFGVGSVIGGTVVIAILVWVLRLLVDIPGGAGDVIQFIVDAVKQS